MRIDKLLVELKVIKSREKAKDLIEKGAIKINGKIVDKASFDLKIENNIINIDKKNKKILITIQNKLIIEISLEELHVSRGYYKLIYALNNFDIDLKDLIVLDVGASTGGFTEALLEKNVKKVIAVDSGRNQLHEKLRNDDRVISIEGKNAKNLKIDDLLLIPDFFVMDLSFISSTKILPNIINLVKMKEGILLFKPQFEQELIKFKNNCKNIKNEYEFVIKNEFKRKMIFESFKKWCSLNKIEILKFIESPIRGKDGNIEYLVYLKV
jgi:23S rRNA (cytidine1920-2'-O)/16S rRNA (cytidine1409-2'-O)-methyltransferase